MLDFRPDSVGPSPLSLLGLQFYGRELEIDFISGIGRCLAKTLAGLGAEVHGISLTAKNIESLRSECPTVRTYCQDVADWPGLKALAESLPVMDGLVNNAATNILEPVLEVTEPHLDKIFDTNVKPVVNLSQTVAGRMIKAGKAGAIVNVSSQASLVALENHVSYAASKAAVDQITRVMALEFGKHNVSNDNLTTVS